MLRLIILQTSVGGVELFIYDSVMNLEVNISFTYWLHHLAVHWLIVSMLLAVSNAFHLKCGLKINSDVEVGLRYCANSCSASFTRHDYWCAPHHPKHDTTVKVIDEFDS